MSKTYNKIFFDFDSTLIKSESLNMLGEMKGIGKQIEEITLKTMSGEIPFEEVFESKMRLLSPTLEELNNIANSCKNIIVDDAKETVTKLQALGKEVYILTSNFYQIVVPTASVLEIPKSHIIANEIYFDQNGKYLDFNKESPLCNGSGKGDMVRKFILENDRSVFVGDGSTDLATKGIVDLFIGFGGVEERQKVKENADIYINNKSLLKILPSILTEEELIKTTTTTTSPPTSR